VARANNPESFTVSPEDMSCGGMCVVLPAHIELYAILNLEIRLADESESIAAKGMVVWTMRKPLFTVEAPSVFHVGIEFVGLHDDDRLRIEKAIQQQVAEQKTPKL